MSKHRNEAWPPWKIAAIGLVWVVVAVGLLLLSFYLAPQQAASTQPAPGPGSPQNPYPTAGPGFGPSSLLLLLSLVAWAVAAVFAGWLIYRMYLRIPAWRRRQLFGRPR